MIIIKIRKKKKFGLFVYWKNQTAILKKEKKNQTAQNRFGVNITYRELFYNHNSWFLFLFLWKSPMRRRIRWPIGCVFSSPSTSESHKKQSSSDNNSHRRWRRSAQEHALTDLGVRNGAAEKERRNVNNRARVEPCIVRNQQGWPAWLVEVADDVIKDWTPRCGS